MNTKSIVCLGFGSIALLYFKSNAIGNWFHKKQKSAHKSLVNYLALLIKDLLKDIKEDQETKRHLEDTLTEVFTEVVNREDLDRSLARRSYDILGMALCQPIKKLPFVGSYLAGAVESGVLLLKNAVD